MRVLLTTDTIGGVWTYTKELTEGLLQRSHAVALVSFGRLPSPEQTAWCSTVGGLYGSEFCFAASEAPLEWMEGNDKAYAGGADLLLKLIDSFRAELLHTNQFCFGRLPTPIPKLVVAHSDVLSWAAACRSQGLDPSPWLNQYRSLVQTGLAGANAVVAPTHWMLQALGERFTLPMEASVISNGRDLPLPPQPARQRLQAVTIGRLWDEAKGLSLLAKVQAPLPIFVAGEDQHGSSSAPQSLGQAMPLGRLTEESLFELLRSSTIYLALSAYEPFGLAPLEAALCGCAVVARDIPSLREVWGQAALYFRDAQALNRLLAQLACDPELLRTFQQRAMRCAGLMSRAHMTELYLELYRRVLKPVSPSPPAPLAAEVLSRVQ